MSSAASPGAGGQSPGHWTLTNNILWETVSSFLTMSSSNLKSGRNPNGILGNKKQNLAKSHTCTLIPLGWVKRLERTSSRRIRS